MGIKYCEAEDIRKIAGRVIEMLGWNHIKIDDVSFLRSVGSSSRRIIARCHALSVPLQLGLGRKGFYTIEVLSERFDRMSEDEKLKVIIHELMHIPKTFGGGFVHHDKVCDRSVSQLFERYKSTI